MGWICMFWIDTAGSRGKARRFDMYRGAVRRLLGWREEGWGGGRMDIEGAHCGLKRIE